MTPFRLDNADLIFCRLLLTHLPSPHAALETWSHAARSGALLVIHETEALYSMHPVLLRYYEMLAQMQKHYGQELNVGALLTDALTFTSWSCVYNESVVLKKSARDMAQLHLANLRTWGHNDFAVQVFDGHDVDHLETQLGSIAYGSIEAGVVYNTARRIVARRN